MKNQKREAKIETQSRVSGRSAEQRAERKDQRERAASVHQGWVQSATTPRDPGSHAKHAQLLVQAKSAGDGQVYELINQMQRHYGNRHLRRVLDIALKGQGESEVHPEIEQSIKRKLGGGQPLDQSVRGQIESSFEADLSGFRAHSDSENNNVKRELNARGFTTGQGVFFKQSEYRPDAAIGRELIAHELADVVQQINRLRCKMTLGQVADKREQEADAVAREVILQEQHVATESLARRKHSRLEEGRKDGELQTELQLLVPQRQGQRQGGDAADISTKSILPKRPQPQLERETGGLKIKLGSLREQVENKEKIVTQSKIAKKYRLSKRSIAQGISWGMVENSSGLIAQIFFPTSQSSLDDNDKTVLREILSAYAISLFGGTRHCFRFVGYADYRGSKKQNRALAWKRARAVSAFFATREPFKNSDFFEYKVRSRGESQRPQFGRTSRELNPYRRVDIVAEPPLTKPKQVERERKILEPPKKEVSTAPEQEVELGKLLPSGGFMIKVALPGGVPIPVGKFFIVYPSGELRGAFTLKTGRRETLVATWKEGKWGLIMKEKLTDGLEFKADSSGTLGLSFYNTPLHPEVVLQPTKPHKPISLNIKESVSIGEIDLGQGIKITGKVELKIKIGVGPGPALAGVFGTAGIVVGGSIAGTIGVLYATARITEAAKEKGIAWAKRIARRNAYAWRIAGEATGEYGYHIAISTVGAGKGKESYAAAYEGWSMAEAGLRKLSNKERMNVLRSLSERYRNDVSRIHEELFYSLGGLSSDDRALPSSPLKLIM